MRVVDDRYMLRAIEDSFISKPALVRYAVR